MGKLQLCLNKTLKLNNVLAYKMLLNGENNEIKAVVERIRSYIRSKGAEQIGPLIQKTDYIYDEKNNNMDIELTIMVQCNNYIHNVEFPFYMNSTLRVTDAMYCRYNGPENLLKFAYDKINVEAFERNIMLEKCSYTVFVDLDEENVLADVFVPRAEKA